jgi:putative ABC transport system permease protein
MTKHLLTLVWNRRRANALVVLEIFISFLVLFAAVTLGAYYADNYRRAIPTKTSGTSVWVRSWK